MEYDRLLEQTPPRYRNPLTWRLPGTAPQGKTVLSCGAAKILGPALREMGISRILLLAGSHVQHTPGGQAVLRCLKEAGISCRSRTLRSSAGSRMLLTGGTRRWPGWAAAA